MDLSPLLSAARDQLGRGDTGQAILSLLTAVEQNAVKAGALGRTLRVLEAEYQAVRQKELKGIIAFDEAQRAYNRINDTLLAVLDDLAAGRVPNDAGRPHPRRRIWVLAAAAGLIVVAGVALWFGLRQQAADGAGVAECPVFDSGHVRVLLLPLKSIDDRNANVESLIQQSIAKKAAANDFPIDLEIYAGVLPDKGLPDERQARAYGERCQADLVLWGIYQQIGTEFDVNIQYAFLAGQRRGGDTGVNRFAGLAALQSGTVHKELEEAVLSLCAFMALKENNPQLATKWLAKLKQKDGSDTTLLRMVQGR